MSNSRDSQTILGIKCSCKGNNLDKFTQPNILSLLMNEDLHGYVIIQKLQDKQFFKEEQLDKTGIYRMLKSLEDRGIIKSVWDVEGSGNAKKVYAITDSGRDCFANWIMTLENYYTDIGIMIGELKENLK